MLNRSLSSPSSPVPYLILIALAAFFCWVFPGEGMGYSDRIVAVVNKEVITWMDLQHELQDETKRMKAKFRGSEYHQRYQQKQREVLNRLIEERLQLQEAKAKGISVSPEEIDNALKLQPLSPTQSKEQFARQMLLSRLFDFQVRRNVVIEEEESRRYFSEHADQFSKPPMFKLQQVIFPASTEVERASARLKSRAMAKKITPNTKLADLASEFSLFVQDLGWLTEIDLVEPLGPVIRELKVGEVSKPVETPLGVHIVSVEEKRPPEPQAFEDVERNIRSVLIRERADELYREWLNGLKQKAFIEIKL